MASAADHPRLKRRRVVVVGAGAVGMACALTLRRDGHDVVVLDPQQPGEGASFGNAGIIANCTVDPLGMPGIVSRVPGMLLDPMGPLSIRWRYLPRIAVADAAGCRQPSCACRSDFMCTGRAARQRGRDLGGYRSWHA